MRGQKKPWQPEPAWAALYDLLKVDPHDGRYPIYTGETGVSGEGERGDMEDDVEGDADEESDGDGGNGESSQTEEEHVHQRDLHSTDASQTNSHAHAEWEVVVRKKKTKPTYGS